MPTFENLESLASVRQKINDAITLAESTAVDLSVETGLAEAAASQAQGYATVAQEAAIDAEIAQAAAEAAQTGAEAAQVGAETARDDAQGVLDDRQRRDVATLLSDTELTYVAAQPGTVVPGDILRTRADGFAFEVDSQSAVDATGITAGGVKHSQTYAAAIPAMGNGIVPEFHFRTASVTSSPKIVIVGDSISTDEPTLSFDEVDTIWGQIQRAFRESNPHLTPVFLNYAWGGRSWSDPLRIVNSVISAGAAPPPFDYGDGTGTWLSYVEAQSPDLVILAFGMNDRQNFVTANARAVLNNTRTWAKIPDLMLVTPMVPNRLSADANISSEESLEGRYFTAHWMRTWALYNRVALLDLNRQYARTVHGVDPRSTHLVGDIAGAVVRTMPYTFSTQTDQDFGVEITGPSSLLTAGFAIAASRVGVNSKSEIWVSDNGGFLRVRFADVFDVSGLPSLPIDFTSAVATPATNFTLTVFVKDNIASIKLGGVVVYEGAFIRHGGRFAPQLRMLDNSTPTATIRIWTARYVRNFPALTDQAMWGHDGTQTGISGGNKQNHPTSIGAAYVYRPLIDAQRWSLPSVVMGATVFPTTTGRNVGIGTPEPKGTLHVSKNRISGGATPASDANTFVVEDASNAGMSLMTGSGGAMRYLMGTAAQPSMAGIVAVASTGQLTLRAKNRDSARFLNPSDGFTSVQLLVNIDGTRTLKPVRVGAADSAGTGFRALFMPN